MSKKLADKVAVVTGASKGIGAAIARQLASDGASVIVNYSSSKEGADRVVAEIKKDGGKAVAVQADVAKKADVERLFAESKKAFGRLDILVNNAGIYEFAPLEGITPTTFTSNSISMSSALSSLRKRHRSTSVPRAGASSTSVLLPPSSRRQIRRSTAERKPPSRPPRKSSRKSWAREKFASTQ